MPVGPGEEDQVGECRASDWRLPPGFVQLQLPKRRSRLLILRCSLSHSANAMGKLPEACNRSFPLSMMSRTTEAMDSSRPAGDTNPDRPPPTHSRCNCPLAQCCFGRLIALPFPDVLCCGTRDPHDNLATPLIAISKSLPEYLRRCAAVEEAINCQQDESSSATADDEADRDGIQYRQLD